MPKKSVKRSVKKSAKPSAPRGNAKITRWIDLLAALLDHHAAVSFERLTELVPAYQRVANHDARRRMFERDKDELRDYGVPIVTEEDGSGTTLGYRLRPEHFYLPYLTMRQSGRPVSTPRRPDRNGYRALAELSFEADELDAVREAALRVRRLGIPALTELAHSAMRKLAFDLPVDGASVRESRAPMLSADILPPRRQPPTLSVDELFERLDAALVARKRVTITYTTMSTGHASARDVWPYGLFFLGHHWYLAAKDAGAGAADPVKNFRFSRISDAHVNTKKPGTPDYEIPPGFSLREHARSREAWALGDTASVEAVVRFPGESGPTAAARRLGTEVPGDALARRFAVRRLDTFARWVLSFAGEAEPVSPPELVAAYRDVARETLAAYVEA
jgi:proteasome accessory factor B